MPCVFTELLRLEISGMIADGHNGKNGLI